VEHAAGKDRTHAASRVVAATPERIYQAMVTPEQLARWLPPAGATARIDLFEPVPGGRFKMTLQFPGTGGKSSSSTDVVNGRFVELVPGERLVQAITFESDDPELAGVMRMTWRLSAHRDGTKVAIQAEHVPPGIGKADHELGMSSTLANLAAFVGA
jgi:uncharacterized protein YndB with AHSA1/START domain